MSTDTALVIIDVLDGFRTDDHVITVKPTSELTY